MNLSIIMTLYNRAPYLQYSLGALVAQDCMLESVVDVNILDDGSTDALDSVLKSASQYFNVNKWVLDRKKVVNQRRFNCPAEAYNILVKLAKNDYILKMDPEMVLIDRHFLQKGFSMFSDTNNPIIMPFPQHCSEFNYDGPGGIEAVYKDYVYDTHITKDNAHDTMVYYMALFRKRDYVSLGGIDERFMDGIGSEDDHFLSWWKRNYGKDNFIPLLDSIAVHLYHGGMAESPDKGPVGVPPSLYRWVDQNVRLRESLEDTPPNQGRDWGRLYDHLHLTQWKEGELVMQDVPLKDTGWVGQESIYVSQKEEPKSSWANMVRKK